MHAEAVRVDISGTGAPDPEVVDLLVVHGTLRAVVMAVRWVTRPVAVRGEQLDAHQTISVCPGVGAREVGHLTRGPLSKVFLFSIRGRCQVQKKVHNWLIKVS